MFSGGTAQSPRRVRHIYPIHFCRNEVKACKSLNDSFKSNLEACGSPERMNIISRSDSLPNYEKRGPLLYREPVPHQPQKAPLIDGTDIA